MRDYNPSHANHQWQFQSHINACLSSAFLPLLELVLFIADNHFSNLCLPTKTKMAHFEAMNFHLLQQVKIKTAQNCGCRSAISRQRQNGVGKSKQCNNKWQNRATKSKTPSLPQLQTTFKLMLPCQMITFTFTLPLTCVLLFLSREFPSRVSFHSFWHQTSEITCFQLYNQSVSIQIYVVQFYTISVIS